MSVHTLETADCEELEHLPIVTIVTIVIIVTKPWKEDTKSAILSIYSAFTTN